MAKKDNPVADAVHQFDDLPKGDIPASVKKLARMEPKDLKAKFYKVTRVTPGAPITMQLDAADGHAAVGLEIPGVKDPNETDPYSPTFMRDEDRQFFPDGIKYSEVLERRVVAELLAAWAEHFTFEPLDD